MIRQPFPFLGLLQLTWKQSYQSRTGQHTIFYTGMVRIGTSAYLGAISDLPQYICS